jgi:hypothetical protein
MIWSIETFATLDMEIRKIFIWIRHNPLKSPDSAKGIQGNPSLFPWFYLDFLGLIWRNLAGGAPTASHRPSSGSRLGRA